MIPETIPNSASQGEKKLFAVFGDLASRGTARSLD